MDEIEIVRKFMKDKSKNLVFGQKAAAEFLEIDVRQVTRYIKDGRFPEPLLTHTRKEAKRASIEIWLKRDLVDFQENVKDMRFKDNKK